MVHDQSNSALTVRYKVSVHILIYFKTNLKFYFHFIALRFLECFQRTTVRSTAAATIASTKIISLPT
jgi:hypothetical protein